MTFESKKTNLETKLNPSFHSPTEKKKLKIWKKKWLFPIWGPQIPNLVNQNDENQDEGRSKWKSVWKTKNTLIINVRALKRRQTWWKIIPTWDWNDKRLSILPRSILIPKSSVKMYSFQSFLDPLKNTSKNGQKWIFHIFFQTNLNWFFDIVWSLRVRKPI